MKNTMIVIFIAVGILTAGCHYRNTPTNSVKEAVESYIEIKSEEIDDYENGTKEEDKLIYILMDKVLDNIKIKYGNETIEGDKSTVGITVIGPSYEVGYIDSLQYIYELVSMNPQDSEYELIAERIEKIVEKSQEVSRERFIDLSKVDGKWIVDDLEEIGSVILDIQVDE